MLTTNDMKTRVLVQYFRESDKLIPWIEFTPLGPHAVIKLEKGKKLGVVVAIAPGIIGWSLCKKQDKFNKEKAIHIALGRALVAENSFTLEREKFYKNIPFSLRPLADDMKLRSEKYYKYDLD